jgi:hypothetical protein
MLKMSTTGPARQGLDEEHGQLIRVAVFFNTSLYSGDSKVSMEHWWSDTGFIHHKDHIN